MAMKESEVNVSTSFTGCRKPLAPGCLPIHTLLANSTATINSCCKYHFGGAVGRWPSVVAVGLGDAGCFDEGLDQGGDGMESGAFFLEDIVLFHGQEIQNECRDVQRFADAVQGRLAGAFLVVLDLGKIGLGNAGLGGQFVLFDVSFFPQLTD